MSHIEHVFQFRILVLFTRLIETRPILSIIAEQKLTIGIDLIDQVTFGPLIFKEKKNIKD